MDWLIDFYVELQIYPEDNVLTRVTAERRIAARGKVTFLISQHQRLCPLAAPKTKGEKQLRRRRECPRRFAREREGGGGGRETERTLLPVHVHAPVCLCMCVYNFIVSAARPRKRSGARATILSNWFREFSVRRLRKVAQSGWRNKKLSHAVAAKVRAGNDLNYLVELSPLITGRTRSGASRCSSERSRNFGLSLRREFSSRDPPFIFKNISNVVIKCNYNSLQSYN